MNAALVALGALGTTLLVAAVVDFYSWVAFGTGGTPPTVSGYLRITRFRFLRLLSNDDLRDASTLPTNGLSYIDGQLRQRDRAPPRILRRTLPQRQYPEPLDRAVYERLQGLPAKYATIYPEFLILAKSITEGGSTDAIFAKPVHDITARPHDKALGDEIAHVHPEENSLHVWLTPTDARKVIEAGWGERFPLSSLSMVDKGWTFLYAPQSMKDVDVIEEIIKAAINCLSGKKLE